MKKQNKEIIKQTVQIMMMMNVTNYLQKTLH